MNNNPILGQLVAIDDDNAQAVRARLSKARAIWSMLSKVLRAENATPRVCGMFYRATVQAVILYGRETDTRHGVQIPW